MAVLRVVPGFVRRQVVHDLSQNRAASLHRGQRVLNSHIIKAGQSMEVRVETGRYKYSQRAAHTDERRLEVVV